MLASALVIANVFGHDHIVSQDGGWCWLADPRAIWAQDKIITGAVNQEGDVTVHIYDPKTKLRRDVELYDKLQKDDHNNPAFLQLPDGRIAAFFSAHTGPDLFMATTENAASLTKWSAPRKLNPNDPAYTGPQGSINAYTYPNPQMLKAENNRIYLFWRGQNWKPTMSFSNDLGRTWSKGKILVSPEGDPNRVRPYMKVSGDGNSTLHFTFTDGHPRNEPTNSIYYMQYKKGVFTSATGRKLGDLSSLPIRPDKADVVYDGKAEGVRAWIWDVSYDEKGQPVIVYSRLPKETEHYYRYATWNGTRWVDRQIVFAGKWFPQTPEGTTEPEPHYSGGICIDPKNPRIVYLSRPVNGRFEIERWYTPDDGSHWSHVAITGNSKHDSVRPVVIRGNRPQGIGPNVLFVNFTKYVHYLNYTSTIQSADEDLAPSVGTEPLRAAENVWRWVRSNPSSYTKTEWMLAPLYSGVLEYAKARDAGEARDWVREIGASLNYSMGPRKSMADDVAVGQAFLSLYELDKRPEQLMGAKVWIDNFIGMPHERALEWKDNVHNEELAWCDSLYMAPPTMAMLGRITGDKAYYEALNKLWWKTSDYLYDPIEHLYYRDSRYFTPREANGKKVFWSRGNGWVLAGLARVLMNMPEEYVGRERFARQFKEMSSKIATLQTSDGTWHSSLLDSITYSAKETSGTAFFVYALAWGIRNGLLDRASFEPVVRRGFNALCSVIDLSGRLGFVQPIGQDPKFVTIYDTDTYGVGAFLLAACEVEKL